MNLRTGASAAVAACLVGVLAGCASDDTPAGADQQPTTSDKPSPSASPTGKGSPSASAEEVMITIEDFAYSDPGPVAPGTEITVENADSTAHTVTADGEGDFDVTIPPGETATFAAPDQPGDYPFVCTFHANMSGTLVVE